MTVVLDLKTDRALRYVSAMTDTGLSEVVRELVSMPAVAMADAISSVASAKTEEQKRAALDQFDLFVEGSYGEYLTARSGSNG